MPLDTIIIKKEKDFLIESTEADIIVTGVDFTLPYESTEMWGSKNLTIRANHLRIEKNIYCFEKNIDIICNYLELPNACIFDVSGINAGSILSAANNGMTVGSAGTPGLNGKDGSNSGSIYLLAETLQSIGLTLKANGGNGGNGQDGGNGANGYRGNDAGNLPEVYRSAGDYIGYQGGQGGHGGAAGRGGNGGNGGKGGQIMMKIVNPFDRSLIIVEINGGQSGKPGKNGRRGTGGVGGSGGLGKSCREEAFDRV